MSVFFLMYNKGITVHLRELRNANCIYRVNVNVEYLSHINCVHFGHCRSTKHKRMYHSLASREV